MEVTEAKDEPSDVEQQQAQAAIQSVGPWPWQPNRRHLKIDHEFFEDGDVSCGIMSKQSLAYDGSSDTSDEENKSLPMDHERAVEFCCHIATCKKTFNSVAKYEMHYNSVHRNVCRECHRPFPNHHLLDVHLQEWHDPMFKLLCTKQNMHQCLVETCGKKFSSVKERKNHLIKVHKYPSNFRFDRPCTAQKGSASETKAKADNNIPTDEKMETESICTSTQPPDSSSQTSKRRFIHSVPKTICFGQGAQRGFHRPPQTKKKGKHKKHWHQQQQQDGDQMDTTVNIEEVTLKDLAQALDPAT